MHLGVSARLIIIAMFYTTQKPEVQSVRASMFKDGDKNVLDQGFSNWVSRTPKLTMPHSLA